MPDSTIIKLSPEVNNQSQKLRFLKIIKIDNKLSLITEHIIGIIKNLAYKDIIKGKKIYLTKIQSIFLITIK